MKKKHIALIAVALVISALYHPALKFYYSTIIGETALIQIPWVQDQVRTSGLGLDAIFCAICALLVLPRFLLLRREDPQPRPTPTILLHTVLL